MSESVVDVSDLTRRFGDRTALATVSLSLSRGGVYGLVGANGAGKTTLIKHILGLLRAESGSVRVFGVDPVAEPVAVLSRIGYLSEETDLPGWMTVDELVRYSRALYPGWDDAYAEELRQTFALDGAARIKTLSKGQKARAGLIVALAHRPELLVLDEPSSGLDPVVRRDILEAIVRTAADEGRTVFFSSHLLDEIERVSDRVAMMVNGRIVLNGALDEVKGSHHHLTLRFDKIQSGAPRIPRALSVSGAGHEWAVLCNGGRQEIVSEAARLGAQVVAERKPSLDEIFVARASRTAVKAEEAS